MVLMSSIELCSFVGLLSVLVSVTLEVDSSPSNAKITPDNPFLSINNFPSLMQ